MLNTHYRIVQYQCLVPVACQQTRLSAILPVRLLFYLSLKSVFTDASGHDMHNCLELRVCRVTKRLVQLVQCKRIHVPSSGYQRSNGVGATGHTARLSTGRAKKYCPYDMSINRSINEFNSDHKDP